MTKENIIEEKIVKKIIFLGLLILLTIFSVSILHTNQYEFIVLRFPFLNYFQVSLFDTTLYISYLIVGIFTGFISDRIGKRKIFIVIGSGGSILFFWLMTITLDYNYLLLFRFSQGSFIVLSWQVIMTLVLDLSGSENRGRNVGIFGIFIVIAMGIGPILGGLFAGLGVFIPYYIAMFLNSIVFILALVLLREPKEIQKKPSIKEVILSLKKYKKLIIPGLFNFVDRLHMGFIIFIVPFFIQLVFFMPPEMRGMVLGIHALPVIFLQYPIGKLSDKYGRYKFLIAGSIGYGIILSSIGFLGLSGFIQTVILFLILGIFSGVTQPPAMALVGDIVDKDSNALGMGFFNFLGNCGIIIGPLIGGLLITISNFTFAFLIAGLIELISLGIIGIFLIWFK